MLSEKCCLYLVLWLRLGLGIGLGVDLGSVLGLGFEPGLGLIYI